MSKFAPELLTKVFARQVSLNHRMILVPIGNGTKANIPMLHERLSQVSHLNDIIWCYKNMETENDKTCKKLKCEDEDNALAKWIKVHNPEYVLYRNSSKILGRTCDMLVLEDFEAISPNMIASCVETVKGGGVIVLLFDQENTLKEIISKKSDLINETGTSKFIPRFNRRLFKSLLSTDFTIFLDSKMRIMDMTKDIQVPEGTNEDRVITRSSAISEAHPLLSLCRTLDQKTVLEKGIDLMAKNEPSVTFITASRGRGKSVALGFSIAEAIEKNFCSILLSALFLENVQTIFEYITVGLNKLGYRKTIDYKIVYSFEKKRRLISKIEIVKDAKKTVEYIHPFEEIKYYPNLLVIDEAASIPLEYLKKLLEVKFVLMASTASGYEGTGRVFRTKLSSYITEKSFNCNRLEMHEPIRYSVNDPVEKWLNESLLLDASIHHISDCPIPTDCALFHVNKDALFSGHPKTEEFLRELFSLFIASHYRNSPNDLQILSDSPNHEIFALLTTGGSPRIACAIQVAFEGKCNKNALVKEGNLIPWVIYENYFNEQFLSSYGLRIVRIAVHPNLISMGYGSMAINLLKAAMLKQSKDGIKKVEFPGDNVLLIPINKINVPRTTWIGSSFGLTEKLLNFWKKLGFSPLCVKQTPSKYTGEFSTVVLQCLDESPAFDLESMKAFFLTRFISLLSYSFREISPSLALSLIYNSIGKTIEKRVYFAQDEITRIKLFSKGLLDARSILDVLPDISRQLFYQRMLNRIPILEQSILLMIGCQHKDINEIASYFEIEDFKITNLLIKTIESVLDELHIQ